MEELQNAIDQSQLALVDVDFPDRVSVLDQGGAAWLLKYQHSAVRRPSDLEEAVRLSRMATQALSTSDPRKGPTWSHLSGILSEWSRTITDGEDFNKINEEALLSGRKALRFQDRDFLGWWQTHGNVAGILFQKAQRSRRIETLDEAIAFQRGGLDGAPVANCTCGGLSRLSAMLGERFRRSGCLSDLNEAIRQGYAAVDMAKKLPGADIDAANNSLSAALFDHFHTTGSYSSLLAALEASGRRLSEYKPGRTPEDFPANHAMNLCQHGKMLEAKCQRLYNTDQPMAIATLDEAIAIKQRALKLLRGDDTNIPHILNTLAVSYGSKAVMTGNYIWGDTGVKQLQAALDFDANSQSGTADDHADLLAAMAHLYAIQHKILKPRDPEEAARMLDKGISKGKEAIHLTQIGDRRLGERRLNLAKMLTSRFIDSGHEEVPAYIEAKEYFILAARTGNAPLSVRIPGAMQAGLFHWSEDEFTDAYELFKDAIALLSIDNLLLMSKNDLQQMMRHASGLASFAASIALNDGLPGFEALRALEVARCVTSGLTMRANTDLSELRAVQPVLADKYEGTRAELAQVSRQMQQSSGATTLPFETLFQVQQSLLRSLADQEARIRTTENFEHFQQPLTEAKVIELACEGPIIAVNVSQIRSDALIVSSCGIKKVRLKGLVSGKLQKKLALFERLGNGARRNAVRRDPDVPEENVEHEASRALEWLWDVAVRPILDKTPLTETKRVWWITAGLAGRAPFHAAGYHAPGSTENTASRVTSSYISSFKALYYARQRRRQATSASLLTSRGAITPKRPNMLLVTVERNPAPHRDLNTAAEEKVIHHVFGPESSPSLTHLRQPDPDTVLSQLPTHSFVHFACHGTSVDYDPSQSGLVLVERENDCDQEQQNSEHRNDSDPSEQGRLLPAMLSVANLEQAFAENPLPVAEGAGAVAYLSACSTAEQADGRLADEAIHLANSLQALGFRHVIGTMWGADDLGAGDIARRFYEELVSGEDAGSTDGVGKSQTRLSKEKEASGHPDLDVAGALHKAILGYKEDTMQQPDKALQWCPFIHIGV